MLLELIWVQFSIINHEVTHSTIIKLEGLETTYSFDNICTYQDHIMIGL